ncbi:MAG: hypothetical protein AB8C02_01605 [Halioglobus sp.]
MRAMESDIRNGHSILLAPTMGGTKLPSWWRIDPISGETIGMGIDGRGSTMTEDAVARTFSTKAAWVASSLARGLIGFSVCISTKLALKEYRNFKEGKHLSKVPPGPTFTQCLATFAVSALVSGPNTIKEILKYWTALFAIILQTEIL